MKDGKMFQLINMHKKFITDSTTRYVADAYTRTSVRSDFATLLELALRTCKGVD